MRPVPTHAGDSTARDACHLRAVWRFARLAEFARMAVCADGGLRGWRFAWLAVCAIGGLRGWRFARLAVGGWRGWQLARLTVAGLRGWRFAVGALSLAC